MVTRGGTAVHGASPWSHEEARPYMGSHHGHTRRCGRTWGVAMVTRGGAAVHGESPWSHEEARPYMVSRHGHTRRRGRTW